MRIHVLEQRPSDPLSRKLNWFEAKMFHGGELMPFRPDRDLEVPLRLWRNVWRIPELFQPASAAELVAADHIASKLTDMFCMDVLPVVFEKCVSVPIDFGRDLVPSNWPTEWDEFIEHIQALPSVPPPRRTYYELRVQYPDQNLSSSLQFTFTDGFGRIATIELNTDELDRRGMLYAGAYVLSAKCIELLAAAIDDRAFKVTEICC